MNRPGPPIALVHFWHPDGDESRPLQAIFAPHTAELHTSVARRSGWLGSNSVLQADPKPKQGACVVAFEAPARLLQMCYVDGDGDLRRVELNEGGNWSMAGALPMWAATAKPPSGAALAQGHLAPDNDFVLVIDGVGHVTSWRLRGGGAAPPPEVLPAGSALGAPGGALVAFNQVSGLLSVVFCDAASSRLRVIWRSAVDTHWQGPAPIDTLAPSPLPPTASLAAAVLGDAHWFVVYVDVNGSLCAAHVLGTAAWQAPETLSVAGFTVKGAGVAALRQTPDMISAFVVDSAGAVQRFWRHEGDSHWSGPKPLTGAGAARPGANLTAAKQSDDESVLVFVAADGRPSICWTFGDGAWQGPALISRFRVDEPFVPSQPRPTMPNLVSVAAGPARGSGSAAWLAHSPRFETWLTGEHSANNPGFYKGADLGANTEHRVSADAPSRLFVFFGDTTIDEGQIGLHDPAAFPPFDGDMIGIIDAQSVSPGMPVAIVPGPTQSFHPYTMQRAGILGTVETPTGAFSHGGRLFVFAEVNGNRPVCYLTSSARPDSTAPFDIHFEVSRTRFIQVAPWVVSNARHPGLPSSSGEGVVMIGRGAKAGETDNHFLAWMPISAAGIPVLDDLRFYAGTAGNRLKWSRLESDAVAVTQPSLPGYSSVSLNWIDGPDCWVLLYTRGRNPGDPNKQRDVLAPIVARIARRLHEWSDEVALFDPRRDIDLVQTIGWVDGKSWAYGPFLLSRFHEWDVGSSTLTLRYLVSGGEPYQVHVQTAQLLVDGRQNVFHRTADDRLEHLWWDAASGLVEAEDWSALVPAPALAGAPKAIVTEGRLSVFYRDTSGGIAQVFRDLSTGDVHLATAAAPALKTAAAGDPVLLATLGQLHVFYRGADGTLQHIVKALPGPDAEPDAGPFAGTLALVGPFTGTGIDNWTPAGAPLLPGAPLLAGGPAVMETPGQQHAFYRAVDGTIQHIVCSGPGVFGRDDWTTRSGAPHAAGDPFALAADDQQHVFFRSVDGAIVHLHWDASLNAPAFDNWTALAGAPLAGGEPAAVSAAGQLHVFYRSAAGSVIHFVRNPGDVRPGWDDWTAKAKAPRAAGDPTPFETPGQRHVFYRAEGGTVAHIFWQASATSAQGVFHVDNWTQRGHGPLMAGRPAVLLTREPVDTSAVRILPLGDSITQGLIAPFYTAPLGGYRSHLFELARQAGKQIAFVGSLFDGPLEVSGTSFARAHEGHAGWAIHGINGVHGIDAIAADVARRARPHIVLLMIGTNDVLLGTPELGHATESLAALLETIWVATGNALVVLAKIPPMYQEADTQTVAAGTPLHTDQIARYNQAIQDLRAHRRVQDKRLAIVDMHSKVTADLLSDGKHPNDRGYAHMASVWFEALKSHLP